ncbi:MAG: amino acid permease [Thermosyntropha sp.]|nr:amino acid permease [Thermosyntropha sp.]
MKTNEKGLSAGGLVMLALGTVIGGSFFLGSAIAINAAGPGVIVAFLLGGALVYIILFSLSEMTVAYPAAGSFRTFSEHMYGFMAGFVVGWVYWTGLVLAMSSEAIAVSVFIRTYLPSFSLPVLGAAVIIAVTLINLLGVDKLSKLESSLAGVKIFAIIGFIVLAVLLVAGLISGRVPVGIGEILSEPFFPNGIAGIAGSMLIVMFTYAGFEIVGLAASEAYNAKETVPRAITFTVLSLVGLYVVAVGLLLFLVPTAVLNEKVSPLVSALNRHGLSLASTVINAVLITAIFSTMMAAVFGIARMLRSLADEGHAPKWLKDRGDIPYRGILFSGLAMLFGLAMGFILPQRIYLFLVSSGGFAFLFVYLTIVATHLKFRKIYGCPPKGKCQLPLYPYTNIVAIIFLLVIMASMPFIKGQGSGLIAGLSLVFLYVLIYFVKKHVEDKKGIEEVIRHELSYFRLQTAMEAAKEFPLPNGCKSCMENQQDDS